MKVLFVVQSLKKAGAERLVINICNELAKRDDFQVAVFMFKKINEFDGELDNRVILAGGHASVLFSLYRRNQIKNESYIRFVKEFEPDIIHSHLHHADIMAHSFYYPKAIYISHLHNSYIAEYNGFILKQVFRKKMWANFYEYLWITSRFKKFNTNFVACSNGAYDLHAKRFKSGKIIVLPNASPIKNSLYSYKEFNGTLKMLWVGRLTNVKRPHLAIQVVDFLKKKLGINCTLKILGIGEEMESCKKLVSKLSLDKEIELVGYVADPQPFYEDADLLLHSSIFEGLPMIFMEANSWCLPIISTDCMPNNEYIEQGENGIIVKTDEPSLIAMEIASLVTNPAKYRTMSEQAYVQAKKFDIEPYVKRLIDFYIELKT